MKIERKLWRESRARRRKEKEKEKILRNDRVSYVFSAHPIIVELNTFMHHHNRRALYFKES